ncbi:MAG: winged helix-turn-helix domain-containing protein [Candidatus Omnitrophica bacterium]|nr:winged helix-turn-helix domain-containing protein [Candidatus Omnitrophota bacterium]MDD5670142.1 winged helix-turn-helix domain-containing protein [Candidatus Omnitrophota bacterium]
MLEQYYAIGEMAGKIYKTLEKNGPTTMVKLQTETGTSDEALFNQALGWLAREDKLSFTKSGRTTKISLLTAKIG